METPQLRQRQTRQRDAISAVIKNAGGPLSALEIHQRAGETLPQLGMATVYRAIKLLLEATEIQAVNLPSGETRYESAHLGHHDHFQCRVCGEVFDLYICPLHLKSGATLPGGFIVEDHEMTLFGVCAICASSVKK